MNLKLSVLGLVVVGLLCSCGCSQNSSEPQEKLMPKPEDFPLVTGEYRMTKTWSISLPEEYRCRFEDDSLVIWRPGITMWISAWGMQDGETPASTLASIKSDTNYPPAEVLELQHPTCLCYGRFYHETDNADGEPDDRWTLTTFTIGQSGQVMMSVYFDEKSDLEKAKQLWLSIKETANN
jgi:hypothetical protein